ncbi:MAG: cytochrome c nitrite reductase small subunit [Proteobacteria bacterium]|jgi:cytochrome c nitrite reductase small subunit|nr:cytochrome c nitrite reductase small subunit [Pseudomonadota bacterium]
MSRFNTPVMMTIGFGVLIGVCVYTFLYAKGWSYLTDRPTACANCHIMQNQYDGWIHSSHKQVATCNTCHTPSNFAGKWYTKATNGFWHSYYFTTGWFEEPIRITDRGLKVVEKRCQQCHATLIQAMHGGPRLDGRWCTNCHGDVGHLH